MKNFEATLKNCTDLVDKNDLTLVWIGRWHLYDGCGMEEENLLTSANDIFFLEEDLCRIDKNLNR